MLDWEGNMAAPKDRLRILVDDLPDEDDEMAITSSISAMESNLVDQVVSEVEPIGCEANDYSNCVRAVREADNVHAVLSSVSSTLDPVLFAKSLTDR